MEKKNRKATSSPTSKKEKENKPTRREVMTSLALGTFALSLSDVSAQRLSEQGMKICGSPANARRFVEAMIDPKSRAEIERNPARAIASYGIQVPKDLLPASIKLPPVDEIQSLLKAIDTGQGTVQVGTAIFIVFLAFFAFFAFRGGAAAAAEE